MIGKSTQTFQPGIGKLSGAWLPGPEKLEHVEERVVPRLLDVDDDALELVDGLGRHHELVLRRNPLSRRRGSIRRTCRAGGRTASGSGPCRGRSCLAVPQLADRPEGAACWPARSGKMSGSREVAAAHRISAGSAAASSGSWSSVASEPREIAARPSFGGALIASNQALTSRCSCLRCRRCGRRWSRRGVSVTSPSAMKYAVSVGVISMVARRMMPVSPLPPTVAQNSSASGPSGVSVADLAVGGQQVHRPHVVAEAARAVVVLAVDVAGDGAADGDLPGAGQHRNPQPERQRGPHQLVEVDAARRRRRSGCRRPSSGSGSARSCR